LDEDFNSNPIEAIRWLEKNHKITSKELRPREF